MNKKELAAGDRAKQLLTRGLGTPITLGMILTWWTLQKGIPIPSYSVGSEAREIHKL